MRETLLVVDGRKRISLGPFARHSQYLAQVHDDGTIILTPAVVVTVSGMEAMKRELEQGRAALKRVDDEPPF